MHRPCASAVAAILLLTLPPLLGAGSHLHAGFAGNSLDGDDAAEAPRWSVLVQEFLTSPDLTFRQPSSSAAPAQEPGPTTPAAPAPPSRENANHGDGATHAAPSESSGSFGFVSILDRRPVLPPLTRAGLLRLADLTLRPYPFDSRLFRPPRD